MAKVFTSELQGLGSYLQKLRMAPKQMQEEVGFELLDGVNRMAAGAKKDAPGNQGILRSEISGRKTGPLQCEYVSGALYSGYLEFGTRSLVHVPAGLEAYAAEVKAQKNTSSLKAKEAIFLWCKEKGIEESAWYPIFIKLMVVGMTPHPFFFKQVAIVEPSIKKNIQNVLDSLD